MACGDRFRGRIIWPIRTIAGETIGFGARRLFDDDQGPKYLNTPETQLYKKSQVLYGIDLAKRDMTKTKQVVIVEGYTDVMAAHLAGITTAVATCGTAFGPGHIKMVRRMITTTAPVAKSSSPSMVMRRTESRHGRLPGGSALRRTDLCGGSREWYGPLRPAPA